MGFKNGAYATVWQVDKKSDTMTVVRMSTSKKNRNTGEYETDFSGFVSFSGADLAAKATRLKERDRIKLGDVEVTTKYDSAKNVTYTNYKCWSFEDAVKNETKPANNPMDEDFMQVDENLEDGLPFDSPY